MLHEDLQYAQQRQSALLDELRARGARARRVPLRRLARAADADHDAGAPARRPVARAARAGVRAADRKGGAPARAHAASGRPPRGAGGHAGRRLAHHLRKAAAVEAARRPGRRHQGGGRTSRRRCAAQRLVAAASRATAAVWGDFDVSRVDQVLTNLVSNAIRYGRGQPIAIGADGQSRQRALLGRRSGHRNSARAPDPHLPAVRTGRAVDQLRRAGAGAVDLAADRRRHGRARSPSAAQVDVGSVFTVELPRDA